MSEIILDPTLNVPISKLPPATTITATDILAIVQNKKLKRTTQATLLATLGITNVALVVNGNDRDLVVTYNNGTVLNLGNVRGIQGIQGVAGQDGQDGQDAVLPSPEDERERLEIVKTVKLTTGVNKDDYIEFELPENFYETILATCQATQDKCKKVLYLRQVKNQDKNLLRFNVNFKPDFDFEWSFYSIQSNKIRIYKDDFSVEDATLEYYEVITDLDIEGYFHLDGTPSTNKPINLSDQYIDQIINLAAEEFERNFQNVQTLSLAKDRTNSEE
jgi:hypothetical protein